MTLDPELLKQLIESFSSEFDEHAQAITNGLLALEKNNLSTEDNKKTIEVIFRSAHNIKGTARSIGINDVGEIAHGIESLFSSIQQKSITVTPEIIDLCLDAVDKMHAALHAFIDKKKLPFDLKIIINNLEVGKFANKQTIEEKREPLKKKPNSLSHESIRVPILNIDKISSLLEEVQVNKIAIDDHYLALKQLVGQTNEFLHLWKQLTSAIKTNQLYHTANDCILNVAKTTQTMQKNMRARLNEMTILSHVLAEEVRGLRMIPIGNLLSNFPRYVRDLSQALNKQVELTIKGEEVKIDKAVLEGLKDPIIHVLRNAIDHGIEDPHDRKLKGKSEVGHIAIDIKEEESKILISITDDGAGIDVQKIAEVVENKNYLARPELDKLNESEILQFIFQPGFSIKKIITDISGRGVGLDVVKSNIEDLKGQVSLSSTLGKGTTFTLAVPLTISSARGLLVKSSDQYFVIPTTSVERVLIMQSDKIIDVQGGQAITLDGNTIPIRMLSDILHLEKKPLVEDKIPIIVVKKNRNAIAFVIDEILGEREIVIKPLQAPLSKIPCVTGGTLLESNQVVLVLEVGDLIQFALQHEKMAKVTIEETTVKTIEKPHILIVDDSITTRTLEKSVLESKNYQVTVAVNGKEAWEILQKQKFSLLITDVVMPIMDGFTLTDNVKKSEKLNDLPVIIVTSLGSDAEKKRGIEVGADAYIVKNEFESGVLLDVVSQLI